MTQRGRKSAAALTVVGGNAVQRHEPPRELTEEQAAIWRDVVMALPADWFGSDTLPLLTQYCRAISRANSLAAMIDRLGNDPGLKAYRDLLRSEFIASRSIASLATKMRITQQATMDKRKMKPMPSSFRPWEYDGED